MTENTSLNTRSLHKFHISISSNDSLSSNRRPNSGMMIRLKRGLKFYIAIPILFLLVLMIYLSDVSYISSFLNQRVPVHRHVVRWEDNRDRVDPRKHRIMITYPGRMGNHMFEYCTLLGTARRNNMTPIIPPNLDILEVFKLPTLQGGTELLRNPKEYPSIRAAEYNPVVEHLDRNRDAYLKGYYQSWKYCHKIRRELLEEHFVFIDNIQTTAERYIGNVLEERGKTDAVLIGVHVRRGDFVRQRVKGFTVAPVPYYYRAMHYFREKYKNIMFFMVTNDLVWALEHLDQGPDIHYSKETDGALDFAIITNCHHIIITSGSFSWWAGYLVRGEVVYYAGYPRPNTKIGNETVREDYYPPWWKGMW